MLKYIIKNQRTGITQKLNAEMYWWIEMLFKIDNYFLVFLITDIFPLSVQMQYTLSVDPSGWGMDVVLTCYLKSSFPHEWKVSNGRAQLIWNWCKSREVRWRGASQLYLYPWYIGNAIYSQSWKLETILLEDVGISMNVSDAVHTAIVKSSWYQHQTLWLCLITGLVPWTASLDWTSTVGDWTNILY